MENDYNYTPGSESNSHNIRNIIFAVLVAIIVAVAGYTIYLVAHNKTTSSGTTKISKSNNVKPGISTPKAPAGGNSNSSSSVSNSSTNNSSSTATTNNSTNTNNSTTQLSNTGPGSVIAVFAVAVSTGAVAHYVYQRRRTSKA